MNLKKWLDIPSLNYNNLSFWMKLTCPSLGYPSIEQKKYRLLFNNVIKPSQCYSSSVNHVTTPISIMFSRIGVNENCAEFVSNYFVPIIQESCKVLVKRHASYNLCPTPIKKIQKTSIEQASSLSVLKSKVNNTSYVNSQLSNPIDIIPEAFERLYTKHNEIR